MDFFVEITGAGDETRTIAVSGPRVVLGSGPPADVVLDDDTIAREHVAIAPRDDGFDAELLPGAASISIDGSRFERGVLPWDTELAIGSVRVRVALERRAPRRRGSPVLLAAPFVVGLAVWMMLSESGEAPLPAAIEHAELFAPADEACSAGDRPAQHRAQLDERAADAKRERYPFAAADGVDAVELYRRAAACYAAAGDASSAARARSRADALARRVESDYGTARFRLSRALEQEQWSVALEEVRALRALLADRRGPYADWLAVLDRRLPLLEAR